MFNAALRQTLAFVILVTVVAVPTQAITLNVLEWEGYISPFTDDFTLYAKKRGLDVKLNIIKPYISDPEYIFLQLRANQADVVTPTHNYFKMSNGKLFNVLQPINFEKLENYPKILKSLRQAKYDQRKSQKYSVPLLGGSYGLAYNANTISPPDSWGALWDPKFKGRYAVTNDQFEANLYISMLALGYPPQAFYDVSDKAFDRVAVQEKLNQLVANAGSFWAGMADASAMKNLDLVTTYWFGVADANQKGQNWKLSTPKEGQTVWLDTISVGVNVNGEKLEAAYLLMDFMISEIIQKRILEMYGSIIVNGETEKILDTKAAEEGRVGDESFFDDRYFWKPLSARTRNRYKAMWQEAREKANNNTR